MSYKVQSSERTRKTAAEAETKSLLYLMNFRTDSDEIFYYVVDFFNDLTGMSKFGTKLWDTQSKGAQNVSPKELGKELVTLFKNYVSSIEFEAYILFVGGVSSTVRKDNTKNIFYAVDIKESAYDKLVEGLIEEGEKKGYIQNADLTSDNISSFLNKVTFVVDDKKPTEYVKAIIKVHPSIIAEEEVLQAIFNEIRDAQSIKKNINKVEGIIIQTTDEALHYSRHLTNNDIRLLTIQRIINRNPLGKGIPYSFMEIYSSCPEEKRKDLLDECIQSVVRAICNNNLSGEFWRLFGEIYYIITSFPDKKVQDIYNMLSKSNMESCPDLDILSLKYFIAIIKDGIQQ